MNVRRAVEADEAALRSLWEECEAELPEPEGFLASTWEERWRSLRADIERAGVYLADDGAGALGMLHASAAAGGRWHLELVYVRAPARRQGVASALLRACTAEARAREARYVSLEVLASNELARSVWQRLGFVEVELVLGQPLDALNAHLDAPADGASRAVIHVQTDDQGSVERAIAQFLPRLPSPTLGAEAGGWIRISDPLLDGDHDAQGRLASDISDRLGAVALVLALEHGAVVRFRLYERGKMLDEYLSVPTYYGPLSKVDELAYAANPTLVARLTGAAFEEVRRVARTAASPADLPPADELYQQIARMMRVDP